MQKHAHIVLHSGMKGTEVVYNAYAYSSKVQCNCRQASASVLQSKLPHCELTGTASECQQASDSRNEKITLQHTAAIGVFQTYLAVAPVG
jgi:hypothetical protein